jgi:hypothetical protein
MKSTGIKELMEPTSDLASCDTKIFKTGKQVAIIAGGSAKLIDRFVRELAEYCDQPVDWHYVGGRGVILTTGNVTLVRNAMRELQLQVHYG